MSPAAQVASRAAEVLAVAERTAVEAQEHSRQCRDEAGVLEAELRARVAGFDARCAESLVALRERAEVQTDEEVARWSTAASGRIDDALRAIDEQADVAAAQIASRAAEVVAEAQEHSRQRLDDAARFEDDLRARLTEQADVAAGQLASRVAEILAVAEQTVAEAQERSRQRLDDSAVFEAELRARLTEQSDVAAGQLASRVAEILVVAERAVTEAQERSRPATRPRGGFDRATGTRRGARVARAQRSRSDRCVVGTAHERRPRRWILTLGRGRRLLRSNGDRASQRGEPARVPGSTGRGRIGNGRIPPVGGDGHGELDGSISGSCGGTASSTAPEGPGVARRPRGVDRGPGPLCGRRACAPRGGARRHRRTSGLVPATHRLQHVGMVGVPRRPGTSHCEDAAVGRRGSR